MELSGATISFRSEILSRTRYGDETVFPKKFGAKETKVSGVTISFRRMDFGEFEKMILMFLPKAKGLKP